MYSMDRLFLDDWLVCCKMTLIKRKSLRLDKAQFGPLNRFKTARFQLNVAYSFLLSNFILVPDNDIGVNCRNFTINI